MNPIPSEPNTNDLDSKVVYSTRYIDHNKHNATTTYPTSSDSTNPLWEKKIVQSQAPKWVLQSNSQGSAKYALQPNVNIPESKMMCSTNGFTSNFATKNYPIDSTYPVGGIYCVTSSEVSPIPWNRIQKAMLDGSIMNIPESKLLYSTMRITSYN